LVLFFGLIYSSCCVKNERAKIANEGKPVRCNVLTKITRVPKDYLLFDSWMPPD